MQAFTHLFGLPVGWLTLAAVASAQIPSTLPRDDQKGRYLNMEVAPLQAVTYSTTGPFLWALNTQGNRLVQFDPQSMARLSEIPIGLGAATVVERVGTDELWVVDRVQGCVSVVSRSLGSIVRTVRVGAEPHGLCFSPSGDRAWVTCSGADRVDVIATATYSVVQSIPVPFREPRGIAYAAGRVWVGSLLSGNGSSGAGTVANPLDIETVGMTTGPGLTPLPDRDLIAIVPQAALGADVLDMASVRTHLGTTLFDVVARPGTNELWIPNTEALNASFKGEGSFVGGRVVANRITIVDATGATPTRVIDLDAIAPPGVACAQPTGIAFDPNSPRVFVCAYGSDVVTVLGILPNGFLQWQGVIHLPPKQTYPRGTAPRTCCISPDGTTLYVFNRNDTSVARIPITNLPTATPFSIGSPLPHALGFDAFSTEETLGRNLFTDGRNSKSGTSSCASCHIDGHTDGIAWDLSTYLDPEGTPLAQVHFGLDVKGPLVTQSTRRMEESGPYHWRGEKRHINEFNKSFVALLDRVDVTGTPRDIGPDFQYLRHYVNRLAWPANPLQRGDRTFTPDEAEGAQLFTSKVVLGNLTCASCHTLPLGTRGEVLAETADGMLESADVPQLRGVAGKTGTPMVVGGAFGTRAELGTGLTHAGAYATLEDALLRTDPHSIGTQHFDLTTAEAQKIAAFLRAFDTGLAPATAFQVTAHPGNATTVLANEITYLLRQAQAGNCDVIVFRTPPVGATPAFPLTGAYVPSLDRFRLSQASLAPVTTASLVAEAALGRPVTFLGVPLQSGLSRGLDRDMDYLYDADEIAAGTNPDQADTDADGLPDGYEVTYGQNPLAFNTGLPADTTPPHLLAPARLVYATTNTLKIEFQTDEPCRVLVLANGVPTQRLPLGYRSDHEYSIIVNDLAPNTAYTLGLVMNDLAGNTITDSSTVFSTMSKAMAEPARISTMQLQVVPGTPSPVLGAAISLRVGNQAAAPGYVVKASVYRKPASGPLETIAIGTPVATDANGVANLRVRIPPVAPSTWYVVVSDVTAPPGAPARVVAYDTINYTSIVY